MLQHISVQQAFANAPQDFEQKHDCIELNIQIKNYITVNTTSLYITETDRQRCSAKQRSGSVLYFITVQKSTFPL